MVAKAFERSEGTSKGQRASIKPVDPVGQGIQMFRTLPSNLITSRICRQGEKYALRARALGRGH